MPQAYSIEGKKVIGKQYRAGVKAGRQMMSGKGVRGQLKPAAHVITKRFDARLGQKPKQMYKNKGFKKGDRSYMRGVVDATKSGARIRGKFGGKSAGVSAGGGG